MAGGQSAFAEDDMAVLSDINVVPLVDVVLVLLIVFMITVPQIIGSAPIKVDLPETTSTALAQIEELPLHLYLREEKDGTVGLYINDKPTSRADLQTVLSGYAKSNEKPMTFLSADKNLKYAEIMNVIDMLTSLGLNKMTLDTKHVAK